MYMKYCIRCKQRSYSSHEFDKWECPGCSEDITRLKNFIAIPNWENKISRKGKRTLTLSLKNSKYNRVV